MRFSRLLVTAIVFGLTPPHAESSTGAHRQAPSAARARLPRSIFVFAALALATLLMVLASGASVQPAAGSGTETAAAVSAGNTHTCAVITGGGVKCWGRNYWGQLGDGTTTNRARPVDVMGLGSVAAVSAGYYHTCALTTAGGVKCWGGNSSGELGDGTTTDRLTPVDVVGLSSGVSAVMAGLTHTCALTTAGGVKCWGSNTYGRLGDGTTTDRLTPVDVVGLSSGVSAVSAGTWQHTCALTTAGGLKCWGRNSWGQLGDGTNAFRLTPVDVVGLGSGMAAVSTGTSHTCALTTAGGLKCWGQNSGALGDGTTTDRFTPVDVVGLGSGMADVSAGFNYTCALTTAGGVKCWGYNSQGRLGDGTTTVRLTPVDVVGLSSGVAALSAGYGHACALMTVGGVKCWGSNTYGQLGDDTNTDRLTPVDVILSAPVDLTVDANPGVGGVQADRATAAGLTFSVDVLISDVSDLQAFTFELEYDQTVLSAPTVAAGPDTDRNPDAADAFLTSTGRAWTCSPPAPSGDTDPSPSVGIAFISCFSTGVPAGPGTSIVPTVLASVEFDAIAPGTSSLTLRNVSTLTALGVETGSCNPAVIVAATCTGATIAVSGADTDGDGFTDASEAFFGTDPFNACAETSTSNDEPPPDAWPLDMTDNQKANTLDVAKYVPVLNSFAPGPPYTARLDLTMNGIVNTLDIAPFVPALNTTCLP